jgi:hypothetical protein
LINIKECEIIVSKVVTFDSVDVSVYIIDKIPYFFKIDKSGGSGASNTNNNNQLLPIVYFLWKFPNILTKFYTHKEVFSKLLNGAGK